ncbi:MAG: hypothetical protein R3C14_01575 [Caldilineaceae bacterium]
MPRQNRVTPFGEIIATPARGTLMGNRGCLHDSQGVIRRSHQGRRWIICLLAFKGRQRTLMTPGQYTELFFLDEATALAAGHRPCAECQRARFNQFRTAWVTANPHLTNTPTPAVAVIDNVLHQERLPPTQRPRLLLHHCAYLPDGSFVAPVGEQTAYLVVQGQLLRWSPLGYTPLNSPLAATTIRLLTPPSVVRTLAQGYVAGLHPSAGR